MPDDVAVTGEAAITDETQSLVTEHHATNTDIAKLAEVTGQNLPPSLQIMLDDRLFARITQLARQMATDTVFTPKHLRGKESACFTVINMSLDWKLNPQFCSRATYETPGGSIGFEGKLVLAILEQSGRFVGGITFEHIGDWSKISGKFEMVQSQRGGGAYPKALWTDKDAVGLGVIVRGQLRNEQTPRVWPSEKTPFLLTQCHPRNSPLWASDPATQICYLAARRFASIAVPNLLGGMMFDHEEFLDASDRARDITPIEPQTASEPAKTTTEPMVDATKEWPFVRWNGESATMPTRKKAIEAVEKILEARAKHGLEALDAAWNNNDVLIVELRDAGYGDEADGLEALYRDLRGPLEPNEPEPTMPVNEPPTGKVDDNLSETPVEPQQIVDETVEVGEATAEDWVEENNIPDVEYIPPPPVEPQQEVLPPTEPRSRQSRDRHDPFWDGRSLSITPPPGKGRGVLDWKLWPLLVQQRIRQAWTKETIDTLYLHNEHNFIPYAQARGERDCSELKDEFTNARAGLPFAADL